jgi:hypothetical protein
MNTSGEFFQPLPIEDFIGGGSHISFSTKKAQISGKYLSGLELENCTFELQLYDDGTCDFRCLNKGIRLSRERRLELLNTIKYQDQTFVNLRNKKIITALPFVSEFEGSEVKVYLSIQSQKPIDKLSQIFEEDLSVGQKLLDKISDLFGEEDQSEDEISQDIPEPTLMTDTQGIYPILGETLLEKFQEVRQEKLKNLRQELSDLNKEHLKINSQIASYKVSLHHLDSKREVLRSRIEDLETKEGSLDYYFWVSPLTDKELSSEGLDNNIYERAVDEVLLKLSKWFPVTENLDKMKELLKTGYYIVKFGKESADGTVVEISYQEMPQDLLTHIPDAIHRHEKILFLGNRPWGSLCSHLVKLGFKQSATFNQQLDQNHKNDTQN